MSHQPGQSSTANGHDQPEPTRQPRNRVDNIVRVVDDVIHGRQGRAKGDGEDSRTDGDDRQAENEAKSIADESRQACHRTRDARTA
jgi:hypothetical protein